MRLKIETLPPLPPVKTWFSLRLGILGFGPRTIDDLRKRLASDLRLPPDIKLQLHGYDLLDSNSISDLLQNDDLVTYFLLWHGLIQGCFATR